MVAFRLVFSVDIFVVTIMVSIPLAWVYKKKLAKNIPQKKGNISFTFHICNYLYLCILIHNLLIDNYYVTLHLEKERIVFEAFV